MSHVKKPLVLAVGLNTAIFVGEMLAGKAGHSASLIMDGIHNFSDELAMMCLFLAYVLPIKMSKNLQRFANLFNSAGLMILSGFVIWHSFDKMMNSSQTIGYIPFIAGLLAAFANWEVARVLLPVKEQNAAIRLAYLHNLGDVYVSLAPVLAGFLLLITRKNYFDPLIAVCIGLWFIWSTTKEIISSYNQLIWPENAQCRHDIELDVKLS